MLKRSALCWQAVSYRQLTFVSEGLNKMLDGKAQGSRVAHQDLKEFLRANVIPVLESTSLDHRRDSAPMRRMVGQIIRDSAFSAHVLRASPNGKFVRSIIACIVSDSNRMHFLQNLTSTQASKTIEYLCKAGVRDPTVFGPLISKVDYCNLKELARVMFALSESGLHDQTIMVVVPLYCGEKWSLTYESPRGAPESVNSASCNVYEAVRALRALSKSTRAFVEQHSTRARAGSRTGRHASELVACGSGNDDAVVVPHESINRFRINLLSFILTNSSVMRGAHWVNTARALVHFPSETQVLCNSGEDLSSDARELVTLVHGSQSLDSKRDGDVPLRDGRNAALTCNDVAQLCLQRVFDSAEHGRASTGQGGGDTTTESRRSVENPFDLSQADLVKLIPVLFQVSGPRELIDCRFHQAFAAILHNLGGMKFTSLVQLLHTVRQIEASSALPKDVVQRIAIEAGRRLSDIPPQDVMSQIPAIRLLQFASLLGALQIRQCPGYVQFLETAADQFPNTLSPDAAASYLTALATVLGREPLTATSPVRAAVLAIMQRVTSYGNRQLRNEGGRGRTVFEQFPLPCVRALRSMVLLDVGPTESIVYGLFGGEGDAQLSPQLLHGGAISLFDLSRSFTHFCQHLRVAGPSRTLTARPMVNKSATPLPVEQDSGTKEPLGEGLSTGQSEAQRVEAKLFERGVIHTLCPLLEQETRMLAQDYCHRKKTNLPSSSYVPVSWRSVAECVAAYVDVSLDARKDFDQMASRATQIFAKFRLLAPATVSIAATQCANLRQMSDSPQALQHLLNGTHFAANAIVHAVYFLLIWEYLVYQSAWEAKRLLSARTASPTTATKALAERLLQEKQEFNDFLSRPLGEGREDLQGLSPLALVNSIFSTTGQPSFFSDVDPSVRDVPLLQKSHILEVTTHLPFAISLVVDPGPVNELFSEKSVPIILATANDQSGG